MANPYFNAVYYLQQNPDVFSAGYTVATAWDHYVKHGANEANVVGGTFRAPNPWFDVKYYLANNPDLVRAGITPATALDHFLNYGSKTAEDRAPNATIAAAPITEAKLLTYVKANADLQTAFGIAAGATTLTPAQENALITHFYSYGYNETRPSKPAPVTTPDANEGKTFTLTTGADNIVGTSANDTITGDANDIANGGTFNNADVINGGAGTDTFNLSISDSSKFATGATVSNVEILNLRDVSAAAAGVTLANFTGLTQVWSKGSSQDTEVTNVQNAVTVGMENTVKNFKVGYAADKLASTTATQAVALNGAITAAGGAVTLQLDANGADVITKLSVDSKTAKSNVTVALTDAGDVAVTDLTVTGNAALTLAANTAGAGGEFNTLKTINAAGMTAGGLTLDLKAQSANIDTAFTGSAGDDKLTLNSTHLTTKDVLKGEAGANTLGLNVASTTAGNSALIAAGAAASVTGFQTLAVTSTTTAVSGAAAHVFTVDSSAVAGVSKVVLGSDLAGNALNIIAVANLSNSNTLSITAAQTGIVNATYKPSDIASGVDLGLTLEVGAAKAAGITVAQVAATQTANLTIKSAGTSANTIAELTAAQNTSLKTITVTGDIALAITADLNVKALTTLDARGLVVAKTTDTGLTLTNAITNGATKGITIYGSNGVDTIKGSAVGDTIWGGLGGDTITLGTEGKTDIVRYTAAAESTSSAKDSVSVFEGALDLLKFEGITKAGTFTLQTAAFTAGGNASALIASTTLGAAQDLSIDFNGDGISDMVISLAGTGTLTTANFEFI